MSVHPGWYPDPHAPGSRYWDGTRWTEEVTVATSTVPPGWYLDASGTPRWWNGLQWTGDTAGRPAAPAPVPKPAPARPAGRAPNLAGQPWRLQRRFRKLGDVRGLTLDEIVAATGKPSSISAMPNGRLVQWQALASTGAYHIAAEFDAEGRCLGITHESSA